MSRTIEFLLVAVLAYAATSMVQSDWAKPQSNVAVPHIETLTSKIAERTDGPRARVIYPNYVQSDGIR